MSNNSNNHHVNDAIEMELKFDSNYSMYIIAEETQQVVNFYIITCEKACVNHGSGIICLWDSGTNYRTIKRKH